MIHRARPEHLSVSESPGNEYTGHLAVYLSGILSTPRRQQVVIVNSECGQTAEKSDTGHCQATTDDFAQNTTSSVCYLSISDPISCILTSKKIEFYKLNFKFENEPNLTYLSQFKSKLESSHGLKQSRKILS